MVVGRKCEVINRRRRAHMRRALFLKECRERDSWPPASNKYAKRPCCPFVIAIPHLNGIVSQFRFVFVSTVSFDSDLFAVAFWVLFHFWMKSRPTVEFFLYWMLVSLELYVLRCQSVILVKRFRYYRRTTKLDIKINKIEQVSIEKVLLNELTIKSRWK